MSLKTASQNRASNFTFTNSRSGGGGVGTSSVSITSIVVTDSNFNNLDDTAIATSNSYIKIIGSGFNSSANIWVAGTKLSSGVTYVNSTEIRVTMPSVSLGNTNIFVFNPDNSGAIWAPGLLVSGTPDFTQTAYTSATPLEVSVQLLATGDATLTYELQAGSSLPGTLTLSSGGLITGATVDGVYQFTVIVSDAQLQSFQQQITLTITSTDANFKSTVLAINADANTFVRDASSNSFAVTIAGDTKPSAFSPYNTNWSNLFDGNGDLLNFTKQTTTSSFTCECWFWRGDNVSGYHCVFGGSNTSNQNPDNVQLVVSNTGAVALTLAGLATIGQTGTAVIQYQWNHIAWVRSGTSCAIFVNGQRIATGTSSAALNVDRIASIGGQTAGTYDARGYISNARITTSAVYDPAQTSITIPVSPLTNIANTYILTCQSNRLIDNSTNNLAITKNGDVKVTAFGPFTETDTTTGSGYFDGTGDYLTVASNSAFTLGSSGDFTVECWVYLTASPSNYAPLLTTWSNASNSYVNRWAITYYNNRLIWYTDAGNIGVTDSVAPTLNEWTHVAAVRSGSTITFYKNGVSLGTQTTAQAYTTDGAVSIGFVAGGATITGYITNARIIKGTAVYTSAFTPPTAALTAITNTSLLTLQTRIAVNNHQFVDHSGINNLITRAGNASQGSFSPFSPAGWSNHFDGTGDYLQITPSSALDFGTGDFTVEFWTWFNDISADRGFIGSSTSGRYDFCWRTSTGLNIGRINTAFDNTFAWTPTVGVWYHIVYCRSGTSLRVFVNGTQIGSTATNSISYNSGAAFIVGGSTTADRLFLGYLSNMRLIKGTALYTSNFTPPTSALTAIANTSLLTCQSNRFIDNSTNNFAITRNGDARVVNFSPFAPTASYSLVTHGGSVYFDGTGDYLEMPAGSNWNFGTGAFTFETWIFPTGASNSYELFSINQSGSNQWAWVVSTGNNWGIYWYWGNYGSNQTERYTSQYPVTGQWNHLVVSRDTDYTWRFYLNGALISSSIYQQNTSWSDSRSFDNTGVNPRIGSSFAGWMTDMRVTKGVALYNTSTINLPAAPLTPIPRTIFLSNFNNPGIIDVTSRNVFETINVQIDHVNKKFGNGSFYTGTSGSNYIRLPASEFYQFGTKNFTVEGWFKPIGAGNERTFYMHGVNTAGGIALFVGTGGVRFRASSQTDLVYATTISNSTFTHIAFVRDGNIRRIFIDGQQVASDTLSFNVSDNVVTDIGASVQNASDSFRYYGYIDDLRITAGVARYTANFTPPTSTFLTQ
jgi:hypothetical protein